VLLLGLDSWDSSNVSERVHWPAIVAHFYGLLVQRCIESMYGLAI
jgi:hypothetical protein